MRAFDHYISAACTQETQLVEDIKLRQEVGGHVYVHCNNHVTFKPGVYMQLVSSQIFTLIPAMFFELRLAYFQCIN